MAKAGRWKRGERWQAWPHSRSKRPCPPLLSSLGQATSPPTCVSTTTSTDIITSWSGMSKAARWKRGETWQGWPHSKEQAAVLVSRLRTSGLHVYTSRYISPSMRVSPHQLTCSHSWHSLSQWLTRLVGQTLTSVSETRGRDADSPGILPAPSPQQCPGLRPSPLPTRPHSTPPRASATTSSPAVTSGASNQATPDQAAPSAPPNLTSSHF